MLSVFRSRAALQLEIIALRPPTWRTAAVGQQTEDQSVRPVPVGLILWSLGRLAVRTVPRQTGNRHRLGPRGISTVLDLEGSPRPTRPPAAIEGNP
jgi:hypothetical protein